MTISRRHLSLSLAALLPARWATGRTPLIGTSGPSTLAAGAAAGGLAGPGLRPQNEAISLTSIPGIHVGHAVRSDRPTGCTAIVVPAGATAGVDVRGSAPGTREIALLDPRNTIDVVHGIMLSGGSAFGLAAADGMVRWLRDNGIGLEYAGGPIPIVPGAILFDLGRGGYSAPDADDGYAAAAAASDAPVPQGSVGAGAGATVGKMFEGGAMRGGLGCAGFRFDDGTIVAALMAVNSRGDIRDPTTGRIVAGALNADGRTFRDTQASLLRGASSTEGRPGEATAIGCIATNRTLDKAGCSRLASVGHDGLARAVVPAHTRLDGDTLFCLATGEAAAVDTLGENDRLDTAVAAAVAQATVNAVLAATGLPGIPAVRDLDR